MATARPVLTPSPRRCGGRGFSLVEILVVIAILVVLMGMVLAAVSVVRKNARKAEARAMVMTLLAALEDYRAIDPQKRYPPADADGFMRADRGAGWVDVDAGEVAAVVPTRVCSLIDRSRQDLGLRTYVDDPASARYRILTDPWGRPYRYRVDATHDGAASKPAPQADWNAKGLDVFPYVWSLGPPVRGTAGLDASDPDADPAGAAAWIYSQTQP